MALTQVELPTVTLTASGTSVGPNAAWDETLVKEEWPNLSFGYANYGDLTISGNSNGSWFEWFTQDASGGSRTITLNGTTITEPDGNHIPLENKDGNFTLILSGDNSITTSGSPAISFSGSSILFQGIGTLTITAATSEASNCVKGIKGSDAAPSPEAASGYALTISDGVDNGNGTVIEDVKGDLATNTIGAIIVAVVIVGLLIVAINAFFPNFFTGMFQSMSQKLNANW